LGSHVATLLQYRIEVLVRWNTIAILECLFVAVESSSDATFDVSAIDLLLTAKVLATKRDTPVFRGTLGAKVSCLLTHSLSRLS